MKKLFPKNSAKIDKIEITNDTISSRGGLVLFMRYVQETQFYTLIANTLTDIKINKKGLPLFQVVKQLIAFFIDRTFSAISGFDDLKKNAGYTASLENTSNEMASSHQIKRFFSKLMFNKITNKVYRKILHELFVWRLLLEKPDIITLGGDTMVLNNDDALQREGSEPTYKKEKGFQPLHISWGWFLIDVLFRSGSKHSNHGTDFIDTVTDIVNLIRTRYKQDVPIILVADSGFFDQKNFNYFEDTLKIHYIITGKMYDYIKEDLSQLDDSNFTKFNKNNMWSYYEFGGRLKSWDRFRRVIFTTLATDDNGQFCLDFIKTDMLLYTNIGIDPSMTDQLIRAGGKQLLSPDAIIAKAHERGTDELIHRSVKELALKEQLPFKHFEMNKGYYYFLVFAHFLYECFKRDVSYDVLPITSYPNTFRRQLIDFAGKITHSKKQISLKVTSYIFNKFNILELWKRCQNPPQIVFLQ
jgi:hypothetical protein